jgi:putative N6-adenine-specific DNA methylase
MTKSPDLEIFLSTAPGLEAVLAEEAKEKRLRDAKPVPGGVTCKGGWPAVWRANLELRGASRVLVRIGKFRAAHLSELDKRARTIAWNEVLRPGVPFRVEATCRRSRIYHSGAAAERIERAIGERLGAPHAPDAEVSIMVRIECDLCTLSVDTSGELLHKRGFKEAVGKAPMRESMAALFLRQCGYDGGEPVLDPMCGSGTFVIEAAEIAAGLRPGRARRFAFEKLASFDEAAWLEMQGAGGRARTGFRFYGSDRDAGAIRLSRANALRAGVAGLTHFSELSIRDLVAPEGPPGLVIVNPPYGGRIGDKTRLKTLYRTLGATLLARFSGWRVGIVTSEAALAHATGLPLKPAGPPVAHGGLRVTLFQTGPLTSQAPPRP